MWRFAWQNLITRPTRTALAVLGLTIPILAFIGLFSLSGGIRHLMGDTLASLQNLMILRENAPVPVLSDLPPTTGAELRKIPGVPRRRGRGLEGRPNHRRARRHPGLATALQLLTKPPEDTFKSFLNIIAVEGQDIREHARLTKANLSKAILPASKGGGRFLNEHDSRQPNVVISTKIARDYPNADGSPKKVGETIRLGSPRVQHRRSFQHRITRHRRDHRHGYRYGARIASPGFRRCFHLQCRTRGGRQRR